MTAYKECKRCVMDNKADSYITFDDNGYCNYCNDAMKLKDNVYFPNEEGKERLNHLLDRIKSENIKNKYDCLMGISGGLDSSYLAYLGATKWGLRILAVHIDDGFDTDISKDNIKKLCNKANIDIKYIHPNRSMFNSLTKAYLKANVPNLAVPQDNVLFASIYSYMKEYGVRTFLSGGNFALESILQKGNTHDAYDLRNIKDIYRRYGDGELNEIQLISNFQRDIDKIFYRIESPRPLNFIEYNREKALKELNEFCDFEYYGSKHLENTLTKFIQVYWLYNKFGVDKRKSHLSSMIISNQMTRNEALEILKTSPYEEDSIKEDIIKILEELDISELEFESIMNTTPKQHTDYKTSVYNRTRNIILTMIRGE